MEQQEGTRASGAYEEYRRLEAKLFGLRQVEFRSFADEQDVLDEMEECWPARPSTGWTTSVNTQEDSVCYASAVTLTRKESHLVVQVPHYPPFIEEARYRLRGRFSGHSWWFMRSSEESVRRVLRECFGTDGPPPAAYSSVSVTLPTSDSLAQRAWGLGRLLAERGVHSSPVRLGVGVRVVSGRFPAVGGGAECPRLAHEAPVTLLVRGVPAALATHVVDAEPDRYRLA